MSISSSAARSTSFSSEQVVAFFLAQEGAELAQKARDDLQLRYFDETSSYSTPWTDFINTSGAYANCFDEDEGCGLELVDGDVNGSLQSPEDCGNGTFCRMSIDSTADRSRYTYASTGSTTPYTRVIYFSHPPGAENREVEVTSRVSWQSGNQRRIQTVEAKTYLFNVYKN
jgi:hypothetical protein